MARQREDVDQGLVTADNPTDLPPGALQVANNLIYRPSSTSLTVAPSRLYDAASTVFGSNITGLRFCAFDFVPAYVNLVSGVTTFTVVTGYSLTGVSVGAKVYGDNITIGTTITNVGSPTLSAAPTKTSTQFIFIQADNYLVAQTGGTYQLAQLPASSTTLTFTSLGSVTEGATLDSVHYSNEHVLLNGKNANLILKSNKATRQHGMLPVVDKPNVVPTTSGGTWSYADGAGIYGYWTTESDESNVIRKSDGTIIGGAGVESTYEGLPELVNIVNTSYYTTVTRPAQVNSTATHWKLWRTNKYTATTIDKATKESQFPVGYLVSKAPISQLTIVDGINTATTQTNKTATVVESNTSQTGNTWGFTSGSIITALATADATNFATLDTTGMSGLQTAVLRLGSFGFNTATITPPVVGIVITVKGKVSSSTLGSGFKIRPVIFPASPGSVGTSASSARTVTLTTTNTQFGLPVNGGTADLWGYKDLVAGDFADGKFSVELSVQGSAVAGVIINIDFLAVTIYYNQGTQTTENLFPAISVTSYDATTAVGRDGPPPVASTGDVFQDSLVVNDVTDDSVIRYSHPTKIDSFPRPYYLNFETREQDKVTNVKAVGNVLIVGLRRQIYRVNYLPRASDAQFDQGRAAELVEFGHGIVGTQAATLVALADTPQQLAYVSQYGMHITDGYRTRLVSGDLNWTGLGINPMDQVILVNNPELFCLEMYYGTNGTNNTKVLYASYHPQHLKQSGQFKFAGPIDYTCYAASVGYPSRAASDFGISKIYTGSVPKVVEEEQAFGTTYAGGVVNATTADGGASRTLLVPTLTTRRMELGGFGNEWRAKEFYVAYSGAGTEVVTVTPTLYRTNQASSGVAAQTFTSASTKTVGQMIFDNLGEGIQFQVAPTVSAPSTWAVDYLVIEGENFEAEEHA